MNMTQQCCCHLWTKAHLKWTEKKWKTALWSDKLKLDIYFGTWTAHPVN